MDFILFKLRVSLTMSLYIFFHIHSSTGTEKGTTSMSTLRCGKDRYVYTKQNGHEICRRCSVCPRGYTVTAPCNGRNDTVCTKCQKGFYSNGRGRRCLPCRKCITGSVVRRKCSPFRNAKCRKCRKGFSYRRIQKSCVRCSKCPSGTFVKKWCSKRRDTVCEKCPENFYSHGKRTSTHRRQKCKRCSSCPPGTYVEDKCTGTRDTICKPCPIGTYSNTTDIFPFCNICTHCRRFEKRVQVCSSTQNNICGDCRQGFFRLPSTHQCVSCSPCPEPGSTLPRHEVQECKDKMPGSSNICFPIGNF